MDCETFTVSTVLCTFPGARRSINLILTYYNSPQQLASQRQDETRFNFYKGVLLFDT